MFLVITLKKNMIVDPFCYFFLFLELLFKRATFWSYRNLFPNCKIQWKSEKVVSNKICFFVSRKHDSTNTFGDTFRTPIPISYTLLMYYVPTDSLYFIAYYKRKFFYICQITPWLRVSQIAPPHFYFFNHGAQCVPKQMQHCRKLLQIRDHNDSSIKMHKCLVG